MLGKKIDENDLKPVTGGVSKENGNGDGRRPKMVECSVCGSVDIHHLITVEGEQRYVQAQCLSCGALLGEKIVLPPAPTEPVEKKKW